MRKYERVMKAGVETRNADRLADVAGRFDTAFYGNQGLETGGSLVKSRHFASVQARTGATGCRGRGAADPSLRAADSRGR